MKKDPGSKPKICFLCEYYPPESLGGAEVSIFSIINAIKKDFDIQVLTPNYDAYEDVVEDQGGVIVHRFKSLRYHLRKKGKGSSTKEYLRSKASFYLKLSLYQRFSSRELAWKFDALNKKESFDAVFANNIESTLAIPFIKSKIKKFGYFRDIALLSPSYRTKKGEYCDTCTVTNLKECMGETSTWKTYLMKKLIMDYRKRQLKKIPGFIAINQYLKKILSEYYPAERINVVMDPVDEKIISKSTKKTARAKLGLPQDKKIFLYVGAFSYLKGFDRLNQMVPYLRKDTLLIAIGGGPLRDSADKRITLLDKVPRDKIKEYYRAADAFILPSAVHYGCGMVQVEAQANSLPVVVSDIRGIDEEIIDGKTGIIAKTPKEFIDKAYEAISNKKLSKTITLGAAKIVARHRISMVRKDFLDMARKEGIL